MIKYKNIIYLLLISPIIIASPDIEEIVITGSLLNNPEQDTSPVDVINQEDYKNFNVSSFAEISKYITSSSGSHFQTNTLGGVDQGMASITLRGLDHSSTLLLINSKRHTFAGTPSNQGEGYIDINIIPEIAIKKIEVLKEGATSLYGSDAVAGVVNVLTQKDFEGFKVRISDYKTSNYNQKDKSLGLLLGSNYTSGNYLIGINILDRSSLAASEMPEIAELGLSNLGRTFVVSANDAVNSGIYAGNYTAGQYVPDPLCNVNDGVLVESECKFLYGTRFNIVNDEDHYKAYANLSFERSDFIYEITLIGSAVKVNDNPQSPSYPALPFLSRKIQPNQGGSPFNVPITWRGRPLGSEFDSPFSPKDIKQFNLSQSINTSINENTEVEASLTISSHSNDHYRPDIIDSRFLEALNGTNMGQSDSNIIYWNIFDSSQNPQELIDYVTGAEVSSKEASLKTLDLIFRTNIDDYEIAYGLQLNNEDLKILYDDISKAQFDSDGKIVKSADLFFLGGGVNVSKNRNKYAGFFEIQPKPIENIDIKIAGRFEEFENDSSFDPKISFKYSLSDNITLRASRSSSFSMPSMAQMFSSDINLGSVRDFNGDLSFVRQAQIGNPNLKPATSKNLNIGFIFENQKQRLSIDYWNINSKNRIEAQSAQVILNTNPNGSSITRNSSGDLIGVTTTYFNEESTEVSGVDLNFNRLISTSEKYGNVSLSINSTTLIEFLTPALSNEGDEIMIDRVGKFNYDTNTHSLPKNRINAFLNWKYQYYDINFNSRYIDGYSNQRSINSLGTLYGYNNSVDSFFVHDLSLKRQLFTNKGEIDIKLSIINLFDESAPRLYDAPDFSFDTRVHDPRGRIVGINFEYRH
ncbi:TonB-dependent receptor [Gammaproteobacteria bacterium]|nr:TonB-dependent receptor [Gammaproteobacteria bacterium]MDB4849125.1 TonB-dependent receptor [Gammaproteobacteria bacterium]MDC0401345.1 TonB-dependent receptor [Gammaproteobacteria bacterium]